MPTAMVRESPVHTTHVCILFHKWVHTDSTVLPVSLPFLLLLLLRNTSYLQIPSFILDTHLFLPARSPLHLHGRSHPSSLTVSMMLWPVSSRCEHPSAKDTQRDSLASRSLLPIPVGESDA